MTNSETAAAIIFSSAGTICMCDGFTNPIRPPVWVVVTTGMPQSRYSATARQPPSAADRIRPQRAWLMKPERLSLSINSPAGLAHIAFGQVLLTCPR